MCCLPDGTAGFLFTRGHLLTEMDFSVASLQGLFAQREVRASLLQGLCISSFPELYCKLMYVLYSKIFQSQIWHNKSWVTPQIKHRQNRLKIFHYKLGNGSSREYNHQQPDLLILCSKKRELQGAW